MTQRALIFWLCVAILMIVLSLIWPSRAAIGSARSVFDGTWQITFTDCQGKSTIYEDCRVLDLTDVFVTFTYGGRSLEIKLPVHHVCATTVMERIR